MDPYTVCTAQYKVYCLTRSTINNSSEQNPFTNINNYLHNLPIMTDTHDEARRYALVRRMISLRPNPYVGPRPAFLWIQDPTKPLNSTWSRLVRFAGSLCLWQEDHIETIRNVLEKLRDSARAEIVSRDPDFRYNAINWDNGYDIVAAFPEDMQTVVSLYLGTLSTEWSGLFERTGLDEFLTPYVEDRGFGQESEYDRVYGQEVEAMLEKLQKAYERVVKLRTFLGLSTS